MDELVEWLRAQLDDDERWALAANRPYEYAEEGAVAPQGGVHWRWVVGDRWETVKPDPALDEFVAAPGEECWLATVETWPSSSGGRPMPRTYVNSIVEMDSAAAGHIVRHDPARVRREVEVKRRRLARHQPMGNGCCDYCHEWGGELVAWPCVEIRDDASVYADRPGYREEWRP